jgi:lysophospholipase L1-like esterase
MAAPSPQVVLFGDSLFQGAPDTLDGFSLQAALEVHCIRRYDVVNRGLSGYNTSQALRALPSIFPLPPSEPSPYTPKIAYLVVLLGANDAALQATKDNQHVDLAEYEVNLKAILTHPNIQAHKPGKILVVPPPPLDGIRLNEFERINYNQETTSRQARISAQYSDAARRVAQSVPNTAIVDLHKALMDLAIKRTAGFDPKSGVVLGDEAGGQRGYLANLLSDGLHLSGEGYRVFFEELRPHIDPPNPRETMEGWTYPEWRVAPWLEK